MAGTREGAITRRRRAARGVALTLGAAGLLAAAPAARADVFAVVNAGAPAPRTDLDIALVNANTGLRTTLPAGVNTVADELHPSISRDGRRLVFQRLDRAAGTTRIVMVDRVTGQAADLFTGLEAAASPPSDPAITPDGRTVATGGPFQLDPGSGTLFSALTLTSADGFPAGPFPHGTLRPGYGFVAPGQVAAATAGGDNLFAFQETRPGSRGELILSRPGDGSTFPLASSTTSFSHPAIAAVGPQLVLFDARPVGTDGGLGPGDIAFRPARLQTFLGTPRPLPPVVNSPLDESQPALTASGRYVAFVRHGADLHDRLFVWDSQTQLIVNPSGVDLGAVTTRDVGNVSLFERPLIGRSSVTLSGLVTASLLQNAGVGILVQRVTGFRHLLGRRVPRLRFVGRVPFGPQRAGRFGTRWDGRVGGRRLRAGVHQVTVRALGRGTQVRDLGRPTLVRIGSGGKLVAIVGRG